MKELFDKGLSLDLIRQECNMTDRLFNDQDDIDFNTLNVATEAFIYAEMELKNDFIQMPLTNRFFRDRAEMTQFIEHYPNHLYFDPLHTHFYYFYFYFPTLDAASL